MVPNAIEVVTGAAGGAEDRRRPAVGVPPEIGDGQLQRVVGDGVPDHEGVL